MFIYRYYSRPAFVMNRHHSTSKVASSGVSPRSGLDVVAKRKATAVVGNRTLVVHRE
jgi:hypothetical protein